MLKIYSSPIFSDTVQKFLDITRRVFCRIINYAFYSTKGSFWEIFLVEICAPHSRISSDHRCRFIAQNFSVGLSNLNPKVSRWSYFRKKLVGIFINFYIFGLWAVTSQTFDKKKTGLPSTVSEILKGEKHSHQKKNFPISFWVWANDFRASGQKVRKVDQNCTLCVQTWFSKKKIFLNKIIFHHNFLNLSWWFAGFWRKMSQKSPKLHSNLSD